MMLVIFLGNAINNTDFFPFHFFFIFSVVFHRRYLIWQCKHKILIRKLMSLFFIKKKGTRMDRGGVVCLVWHEKIGLKFFYGSKKKLL